MTLLLIFIILFIIVLTLFCIKGRTKKKHERVRRTASSTKVTTRTRSTSHHNPIHVQTQKELIAELPREVQLDYTQLFNSLNSLEDLIDSYSDDISREQTKIEQEIRQRVSVASEKIRIRWQDQANRKRYRECIALHYASFTLADSIYEQKQKIGSTYNKLRETNDNLGEQIKELNNRINSKSGNLRELKQQHKALCNKRHQISQIQIIYGKNLKEYKFKLDTQNQTTEQYREYIGANFGNKGKAWLERLNQRKAMKSSNR